MVTLSLSAEQQQIVDSVVDVLGSRLTVDRLRNSAQAPGSAESAEWGLFAELGWFGIGLPEDAGGIGYTVLEETLLNRELGRYVLSPTVLGACLGAHLAWEAGDADLAHAIAAGSEKIAIALPAGPAGRHQVTQDQVSGDYYVADRMDATWAIVWGAGGVALVSVGDGDGLSVVEAIDTTLRLERVSLNHKPFLFAADQGNALRNRACLLLAANLVGMAEASRDMAAEYARVREQFGKPIGSFQAIGHHCANMAARAEAAWVQTKFAALAVDEGRADAQFQVSAAYLLAAEAASTNAAMAIRVHGAMGFTAECNLHHFLKRSVLMKSAGGGMQFHARRLVSEPAAAA
jgi:alkylation response protein AidB-like acyl-CoA dehydrogenase